MARKTKRATRSASKTEIQLPNERRLAVRFPVMLRVDYEVNGRSTFKFTSNVSSGGMFLRGKCGLKTGSSVEMRVSTGKKPSPR